MAKQSGAYTITHDESGMVYVGSSVDTTARMCRHKSELKNATHKNKNLQKAFDISPDYTVKIFPTNTEKEARALEQKMLDEGIPTGNLFNVSPDAAPSIKAIKGIPKSEKHKKAIGEANAGKVRSEENKKAISETLKNRNLSEEHKLAISAALKNKNVKEVIINGITHSSVNAAAKEHDVHTNTAARRIKSEKYPNWQYK